MTEELKLCPFCGGNGSYSNAGFGFIVKCRKCGSKTSIQESGKEAAEAWNSRYIENELHGKIEELESENKRLRESLEFYALGKHLLKASGVVCDAYDIVSGRVENGKYAQEVLKGCAK